MILTRKFLLIILLCWPFTSFAETTVDINSLANAISNQTTIDDGIKTYERAFEAIELYATENSVDQTTIDAEKKTMEEKVAAAKTCDIAAPATTPETETNTDDEKACTALGKKVAEWKNGSCICKDTKLKFDGKSCVDGRSDEEKAAELKKLQDDYEAKKANEQSLANRTLTATAVAATGIGTMELLQGRAEQRADDDAAKSMAAYIETMRCTYGEGKQVKAGQDEIELPGGNDADLMKYRTEYFALAADLKERKNALGMKPGIESEEILDKSQTGLYDDENVGITGGAYESLYRAQMLGSEKDQTALDDMASTSKKRVLGGAIAAGAGVVVGVAGNALINGELGKKIKEAIANKKNGEAMKKFVKEEENGLKKIKDCLKKADVKNTDKLTLDYMSPFYPSLFSFDKLNCKTDLTVVKGKEATELFTEIPRKEENDNEESVKGMVNVFGAETTGKLLGVTISDGTDPAQITKAAEALEKRAKAIEKRFEEAKEKDENSSSSSSIGSGLGDLIQKGDVKDKVSQLLNKQE